MGCHLPLRHRLLAGVRSVKNKKVLILAPHVDDEMIGCWSVISNPDNEVTVHYFFELSEERKKEAKRMLDAFDPQGSRRWAINWSGGFDDVEATIEQYDEVYCPSRRDSHADHRAINARFRLRASHFYSVDMVDGVYLGDMQSERKRDTLNFCYPSQNELFASDAKYWLFESITTQDYLDLVTFKWFDFELTIPRTAYSKVYAFLNQSINTSLVQSMTHTRLFNNLLSMIPNGKVKVVSGGSTLETY